MNNNNQTPIMKGSRIDQLLNCKKKEEKGPQLFKEQHPQQDFNQQTLMNRYQYPVETPDLNPASINPLDRQMMNVKPKFEFKKPCIEDKLIILPSPSNNQPKKNQTNLENYNFKKCPEKGPFMQANRDGKYEFKLNQSAHKVQYKYEQKQEQKEEIIDLTNRTQEEIKKLLNIQNTNENQKNQTSAQKLADRAKLMRDPKFLQQGEIQLQNLLNEDGVENKVIKIAKRDANSESKRFLNYKQMFETNQGQFAQNGKPLFEFNRLLRYLFLKDYIEENRDDEFKVIPNSFQSNEEYCKIFEYLFLNECTAQIKQEIESFIKKSQTKYRRLQVKYDENNADKDGTILAIRPYQEKGFQDIFDDEKQEIKIDSDEDIPVQKDNNCDLTQLKNYIVIISKKFKFTLKDLSNKEQQAFFGMLVDPQKHQFINSIKLQTFIDKSKLPSDWFNVVLFPFSKITTIIREYHMITNLGNSSLGQIILNPINQWHMIAQDGEFDKQNIVSNSQLLNPFFDQIYNRFNPSQFKSIKEISLQKEGISLLQGPPGTGKTHTLLGLLSAVYEYMTLLQRFPKRKILICAPSNAAIDEIIMRIINGGIINSNGQSRKDVQIVRLGVLDEENQNSEFIKNVSIEDMAQQQLFNKKEFQVKGDQRTSSDIRIEINNLQIKIRNLEKKIKQPGTLGDQQKQITSQLDSLYSNKRKLQGYLDDLKQGKRNFKESYQDYIDKILSKAEIICSTLSTSGSDKLMRFTDQFDILIVDEAAQSTEPSNIIPLRLGINKMVLIGDPKQLPATTFSPISSQTLYNRSLFERILDNGFQPYFLNIQYRMHREIRQFPSQHFYQGKLCDDENNSNRITLPDYFRQRVLLIDIKDSKEQRQGYSYINNEECEVILQLSKFIRQNFRTQSLGIICAYKAQVKIVKKQLKNKLGDDYDTKLIAINTVDSFQGQEKDIILFSTVRSSSGGYIGFLSDARRMNVALTRARECIFLIGNAVTLCTNNLWRALLRDYKKRGYYRCTQSQNPIIAQQIQTDQWNQSDREMNDQILKRLDKKDNQNEQRQTFNLKDFESNVQAKYFDDGSTNIEIQLIQKQENQQIKENQNQKQQIIEQQKEKEKSHTEQQEIKQPQGNEIIKIKIKGQRLTNQQQQNSCKQKEKPQCQQSDQQELSYFDDLLRDIGIY